MYNCRSHSPTAAILAGYDPHPKRKAAAHNSTKGPRKVPRQGSQSSKTQTVTADSSSGDDTSAPLKMDELEGANSGFDNDGEDSINQDGPNNTDNKDPEATEERSHARDELSDSEDHFNKEDQLRSTTTIATRGRVADANLKLSLACQVQVAATVSKLHKPFIPLDFEAIRQGFLEGGVKSTDGNSTSSTSLSYNIW